MIGVDHIPWAWLIFGLVLCAAEMIAPGVFLLWIGLSALAVGLLQFVIILPFAPSLLVFAVLAALFSLVGRKVYGSMNGPAGQVLNSRADALRGKIVVLTEPIVNGTGRAKVQDSIWQVTGPDQPAGASMRVTGVADGVVLRVEPV